MTAANENRTHIYRIRRKSDGLFLASSPSPTPHNRDDCSGAWQPVGTFWKKPETIRKHLLELCRFRVYVGHGNDYLIKGKWQGLYPYDVPHRLVSTNYQWLDLYEVIATEITIHGENTMEAREFASFLEDVQNKLRKCLK